jgi:Fur family ferric uptake transcriptional regulator
VKRATRQRAEILGALDRAGAFSTAQELHARLRAAGSSVGLTTVYRNLQDLAADGTIDAIVGPRGESMFRRCSTAEHHHHLICTSCRGSIEVDSAALERWATETARRHGFTAVDHVAELFGLCERCSV